MYRTVIWPLLIVTVIPVLAWANFERTGWGYVAALAVVGLALAGLAATYRNVDHGTLRTGIMVVTVLAIAATAYAGVAFGDPLLAVPFLAAIAGVAAISRAPDAPRPSRADSPRRSG